MIREEIVNIEKQAKVVYCSYCGKKEVIGNDSTWNYVPTNNGRLSFDTNSSTVAFKIPDLCSECFGNLVISIANKIQNEINEIS